ncbi:hypothetical protein A5732_16855 [Mycobacterium colombiense]|nr:hypothetical protein A5732_16855 [Mycobacterium colombiense]
MAIRNQHADRIYRGDKRFEFRRQRPRFTTGLRVYIYEPTPVQLVTGHFCVSTLIDVEDNLVALEQDKCARTLVESYLQGARRPTAIGIVKPMRLDRPLSLAQLGVTAPPQSYVYVDSK